MLVLVLLVHVQPKSKKKTRTITNKQKVFGFFLLRCRSSLLFLIRRCRRR